MKTVSILGTLLVCSIMQAQTPGQVTSIVGSSAVPAPTPYTIVSQGANHRVWQRTTYEQAPDGSIVSHLHQYTELATGLNHLVNGQWVASSGQITISPDGSSAAATNGQHQVYFPGNIYNGVIKLVTPDGKTLQSQPIGLSYFDGTNSVLLAVVTNSTGAVLPSGNQVIYTNAFIGLDADLLYTYTKAGFEQDVVLREQPPDPVSLGLNPRTTRLQVLTEFFNPPQPRVTGMVVPTTAGKLEDDNLNFGAMAMGQGKVFLLGMISPSVRVDKQWLMLNGRDFLIEEVPIVSVAKAIDTLPPFVSQVGSGTKLVVSKNLILPPQRVTKRTSTKSMFLAQAMLPSGGLVLDYVTMISQTNYTFQGDMTYYISGVVNLSGTNIFEGGTVLKYATNATVNVAYINCQTAPYRPVYFTGKDDDRTGEWISGTTHNPANFYANPALTITASGQTLSNFRIAYAQQGIATAAGSSAFDNGQFVNCGFGLTASGTANFLRNVLFSDVNTNFNNLSSATIDVQNGSFGPSSCLASVNSGVTIVVTNSVLANVTNLYSGSPAAFTGGYNGFYNSPEFGVNTFTNNFYPFQTVGAGGYYLAGGCAFTNAGTANIDPTLLADLANLTVYPPIVYSNVAISTNLVLSPQAQRDTNASPDLGYHYAPLDYAFGGVNDSSNITFTAGTAAGWFDLPSFNGAAGYGISLYGQVIAAFDGTVTAPCVWARYDTVQEGGNGLWVAKDYVGGIASYQGNSYNISVAPQVLLNFTHCAEMDGDPNHFRDYYTPLIVIARNSEFWSGSLEGYNNSCYLTNCLVYRMSAGQDQGYNSANAFVMRNCTWYGGLVYFVPNYNPITLSVRDCAFDGTTFTIQNYGTNGDYDYNAYTNGAPQLANSSAHDVLVTDNYNWQTSWLGNYYLPPNSPLINAGDVTANTVGLYHFTTQTNQTKEADSQVDIGYHYVATDAYGNPQDTDGDGVPDYLDEGTYYVSKTGSDSNDGSQSSPWATIYTSIPKLNSGDTLFVSPGSYVSGTADQYTFDGSDIAIIGLDAVVDQVVPETGNAGQVGEWTFTGNNVKLSGFTFTSGVTNSPGATTFGFQGVVLELDGSQDFIHDCIFSSFSAQLVTNSGYDPFLLLTTSSSSFDVFSNLTVNSIYDFDVFEGWGISNVIENCNVYNCYNSNYNYGGSSQLHADFFQTFGSDLTCEYYTIKNCYLHDSEINIGDTGTDGSSTIHDLYFYNDIFANWSIPLYSGIPSTKFYNCIFYQCASNPDAGNDPISFYTQDPTSSSANSEVVNCIFLKCGPYPQDSWEGTIGSQGTDLSQLRIENNYFGGTDYAAKDENAGAYLGVNYVNGGDPHFVNEGSDFHLTSGSPLIGSGTNLYSIFTTDRDGNTWPATGAWDIGPYEYLNP